MYVDTYVYMYVHSYIHICRYGTIKEIEGKTRDSVSADVATLASNGDISVTDALSHENICTGASSTLVQVRKYLQGLRVHPHILLTMDALYEGTLIPSRER